MLFGAATGIFIAGGNPNTIPHLTAEKLRVYRFPKPPRPEQAIICEFLDGETARIDSLIGEQQRLIELLNEKRQAVISHAVTKGLNPDVPMKPSGVEWLGDVPAHWSVISIGRVTLSCCDGPFGSGLKSEHYCASGIRVVRLQNIRPDRFDALDEAFIAPEYYHGALGGGHDVKSGDVLIAGLGDENHAVGRACVAPVGIEPAMVKADCFRFRIDPARANPNFIATTLSATAPAAAGLLSSGSTRSRIPLSVTRARKIALPPVAEQDEVSCFVWRETARLDELIVEADRAIQLLQERRAALISAAVTGQIDVRGMAAAGAPDLKVGPTFGSTTATASVGIA